MATQSNPGSGGVSVGALLYIVALTPIHPGVGRAEGAQVDLPVQRDEFGLPTIWASSLKGALKSYLLERAGTQDDERSKVLVVFGPEPGEGEASDYTSSASLLDARLLLIPARSLKGLWIYVTSPHMLKMLNTYREVVGYGAVQELRNYYDAKEALVSSDKFYVDGNKLVVNEVEVKAGLDSNLSAALSKALDNTAEALKELGARLDVLLLPDDLAPTIVRRSLLVQYRVRLGTGVKKVEEGPWSEEYVPQFTVFVSGVLFRKPSRRDVQGLDTAEKVRQWLTGKGISSLALGGKESIGKGIVRLVWV